MKIIQIVSHEGKLVALTDSGQLFERVLTYVDNPPTGKYVWQLVPIPMECAVVTKVKGEQPNMYIRPVQAPPLSQTEALARQSTDSAMAQSIRDQIEYGDTEMSSH